LSATGFRRWPLQAVPTSWRCSDQDTGDFTPLVEWISIDEAFADVTGCTHLFGSPADSAAAIRHRVRTELGLPVSVGVARTKHLAKIASQVAKPDGLVVVDPATELEFLHDLPVELMWGVGPVTKSKLVAQGILTIGQLAHAPGHSLERFLDMRREKSSEPWRGTAIHEFGLGTEPAPPVHNRHLARGQPKNTSSGRPCSIWPTGWERACAVNPWRAGR
jgi:hypothetical protein